MDIQMLGKVSRSTKIDMGIKKTYLPEQTSKIVHNNALHVDSL